jgi:hypothetical protein
MLSGFAMLPSMGADNLVMARRLWNADHLPMPRVFMIGPRWRRHFGVKSEPRAFRSSKLTFTFEPDVRELVLDEIRPGVYAQWSDPFERLGLRRG